MIRDIKIKYKNCYTKMISQLHIIKVQNLFNIRSMILILKNGLRVISNVIVMELLIYVRDIKVIDSI